MIIDSHVHIFPDAIAERAISKLVQACYQTPNTNGTVSDTLRKIDEWGIDKIWALGVSTNAKQVHNVNAFLNSIRSERIEPLGSLYPYSENVMDDLKEIVSSVLQQEGKELLSLENNAVTTSRIDGYGMGEHEVKTVTGKSFTLTVREKKQTLGRQLII